MEEEVQSSDNREVGFVYIRDALQNPAQSSDTALL